MSRAFARAMRTDEASGDARGEPSKYALPVLSFPKM